MRDETDIKQILILTNMESYNAILIEQEKTQSDRLVLLHDLAITQIQIMEKLSTDNLPKAKKLT